MAAVLIVPRDHQSLNMDAIRAWFLAGILRILWYMPTGAGKSVSAGFMLQRSAARGYTCWFIVHRRELIRQTERTFRSLGLDFGVIAAGYPESPNQLVQICSMGTLMRRIDKLPKPHTVILDECHHLAAKSWTEVLQKCGYKYLIGLSATPCRMDGRGLGAFFDKMVMGLSIGELIAMGYLSPFRTFAPKTVDDSRLKSRGGDYVPKEAEQLMDKPAVTGSALDEYRKLCDGKRAIVFCTSIKHSKSVAQQFREAGYAAAHVDGTFNDDVRDGIIADFESGALQILCNVDICGEGLSINAIECVILLRPTQSLGLYIQQVGRGLRTWPGKKELIILDHANLTVKFGLIDEPREWTLSGDEEKKKASTTSVRVCPKCWAATRSAARTCGECGYEFPVKSRNAKFVKGDLEEVDAEELRAERERQRQDRAARQSEEYACRTLDDWHALAKKRGHKAQWAWMRFKAMKPRESNDGRDGTIRTDSAAVEGTAQTHEGE
jgi:DNA repair protein RadD